MPLFESLFIKTDVTCVKIYVDLILVGIGGYIYIYHKYTKKLIKKKLVFDGENICGIIFDSKNYLFVYSGTGGKLYEVEKCFSSLCLKRHISNSDWILDAKWIDNNNIATLSMHNKFQLWDLNLEKLFDVECEEKCILYSAHLVFEKYDQIIALSGTVFSEILIWQPSKNNNGEATVLRRLQGHKGVIFSIDYNLTNGFMSSSSDDRSTMLWKIESNDLDKQAHNMTESSCRVFGHQSRIFRSCIRHNFFVTAGEDSVLNIWTLNGILLRRIDTYHGDSIWGMDCDRNSNIIVGSGDGAVTIYPVHSHFTENIVALDNMTKPRMIGLVKSGALVILSESGDFIYYSLQRKLVKVQSYEDLKVYAVMEVSMCRSLVALAGFHGQIYIFKEISQQMSFITSHQGKQSRVFSLHWLTCEIFLTCQKDGEITLFCIKEKTIVPVSKFLLPLSKERWTTTAAFCSKNVVIGDRKGNVHLFEIGLVDPIQTLKKVHNHLGVTNVIFNNGQFISLGRNGVVKTFALCSNSLVLHSSDKTPFMWLVDIIADLLFAFTGNDFIICEYKTKRILWKTACGGGHRSWDIVKNSEMILFSYIKDKVIHNFCIDLKTILPTNLIENFHVKEVNAIKTIKSSTSYIVISGGEDTTLRISLFNNNHTFINLITLKSHLSSIRALALQGIEKELKTFLVFSAGGRAQVICWKLKIEHKVTCSEQHSYYRVIDNEDSEMRIMALSATYTNKKMLLFCACSDGNIQMFNIESTNGIYKLIFNRNLFYKLKCILKLCVINVLDNSVLVTMATDGKLAFWNIEEILSYNTLKPFFLLDCHQSGINSCSHILLENGQILILTGGDDNAIVLNYLHFSKTHLGIVVEAIDMFRDTGVHCAQITGAFITDRYFITAAIDQRVALFAWRIERGKLHCQFVSQYKSSIPDIQGIECWGKSIVDTFIFGKGIEAIKVRLD